jgi:ketosteroid isomerase-like protein
MTPATSAVLLTLAFLRPCLSAQQQRSEHQASSAISAFIIQQEKAVWQAAKNGDIRKFNTLVADDARMIFSSGVQTKRQYLQNRGSRRITDFALSSFEVLTPSPDTAIVLYEATITGAFGSKRLSSFSVREASVWVRRPQGWVAVLNQETPTTPTP